MPRLLAPLVALVALVVAVALPASASAIDNDNYFNDSFRINQPDSVLPASSSFNSDLLGGTLEADLMSPVPTAPVVKEPSSCKRGGTDTPFDNTGWYDIFPHRPGNVQVVVESNGFTSSVALLRFDRPTGTPDISENSYKCTTGAIGRAHLIYPFRVVEGGGYSIQVGRVTNAAGKEGPYNITVFFDPDTDRDGPVDSADQCPGQPGKETLAGCPDVDNDNIRDGEDRCPSSAGPAQHRGCPDADGDGLADPDDRCAGQAGTAPNRGCPDADGDGLVDLDDACDGENARKGRDRNQNGCPDRELLKPELKLVPGLFCKGTICLGIKVEKLVVSSIPTGAKVTVSCTRKACKTQTKTAGRSHKVRFFSGQNVRAGVKINVKVARGGFVSRVLSYTIKRNDLSKGNLRCLSGGKATACSTKLLIR